MEATGVALWSYLYEGSFHHVFLHLFDKEASLGEPAMMNFQNKKINGNKINESIESSLMGIG